MESSRKGWSGFKDLEAEGRALWEVGFVRKRAWIVTETPPVTGQPQGLLSLSISVSSFVKWRLSPVSPAEGCSKASFRVGSQLAGRSGVSFSGREAHMIQLC